MDFLKSKIFTLMCGFVLFVALYCPVYSLYAQDEGTGTISGQVLEQQTGAPLPAANVIISETGKGVAADDRGVYIIRHVPSGRYILRVSYIGYETEQKEVVVRPGETATTDFALTQTAILTDEVVVTALARGRSRAIMEQREAESHKYILTSEQMERFGDFNLAHSLMRLPGISADYDMGEVSGISIRGIDMNRNLVQIDGISMASTDETGRGTQIASMTGEMVTGVEVIRVPTPDMSSDALGGIINIRTDTPTSLTPEFRMQTNAEYGNLADRVSPRTSLRYSQRLGNIGISLQGEYRRTFYSEDRLQIEWRNSAYGWTVDRMRPRYDSRDTERYGISGRMTFEPSRRTTFFVSGIFNIQDNYNTREEIQWRTHEGLIGREGDEFIVRHGRIEPQSFWSEGSTRQYTLTTGGSNRLRYFDLDYSFSTRQGVNRQDLERLIEWRNFLGAHFTINNMDYKFPRYTITSEDFYNPDLYEFRQTRDEMRSTKNLGHTGQFNVKVPFIIARGIDVSIKFGGNYDYSSKDRKVAFLQYEAYQGTRPYFLADFSRWDTREILGNPHLTQGLKTDFAKWNRFFEENIDDFDLLVNEYNLRLLSEYESSEEIMAGYLMATVHVAKTTIIGGVRVENTGGAYKGLLGRRDRVGDRFIQGQIDEEANYTDYTPSLHIRHNFSDYTIFRFAFTTGIKRAPFLDLMPREEYDYLDRRIELGNPDLNPEKVMRFDFFLEHYIGNIGHLSAGLYFHEYRDFIYYQQRIIWEGDFRGWQQRMPVNGVHAQYYGLELSWQQQLDFLPGLLRGIGINSNYTYSFSRAIVELPYIRTTLMPGLRPWELNLGITYDYRGFSGLIAANYTPDYLQSVNAEIFDDVYLDRYTGSEFAVDITLRQRILKSVHLSMDLKNITNTPRDNRYFVPVEDRFGHLPRFRDDYRRAGMFATLGLRFDF
jgi:TonB-dependent receptor